MLAVAFILLGAQVTWLELVAFVLTVGCVVCNLRELHWGWPLSIASSLLYGWLFADSRLYGEAALQAFFAGISAWGWRQWLRGGSGDAASGPGPLRISRIGPRGVALALGTWAAGALVLGLGLDHLTDSDVPWFDAVPTAGSVLGQWMLARKHLENWGVWIAVNLLSVALFAWKALWLTALLYLLLALLAMAGLAGWRRRLAALGQGTTASTAERA
ncbi:MAG: hypothetical protein RIS35_2133 [Pseudomonadota bacterium]|jgi:nicotinamide mononucleotide transporter